MVDDGGGVSIVGVFGVMGKLVDGWGGGGVQDGLFNTPSIPLNVLIVEILYYSPEKPSVYLSCPFYDCEQNNYCTPGWLYYRSIVYAGFCNIVETKATIHIRGWCRSNKKNVPPCSVAILQSNITIHLNTLHYRN